MGNSQSIKKINYEDIQYAIKNNHIIINTIDENNQTCLIKGTLNINEELSFFNNKNIDKSVKIIIYGINSTDDTVFKKYNQLLSLGFINTYIYIGGLFEWLLLQDIFDEENFPTISIEPVDILKYKGKQKLNILLLK